MRNIAKATHSAPNVRAEATSLLDWANRAGSGSRRWSHRARLAVRRETRWMRQSPSIMQRSPKKSLSIRSTSGIPHCTSRTSGSPISAVCAGTPPCITARTATEVDRTGGIASGDTFSYCAKPEQAY